MDPIDSISDIEDGAAACLILLYAQTAAKIVTLTTDDLVTRGDGTYLRLGAEPLLLIPPLNELLAALPVAKPFGTASFLADPRWLFTGMPVPRRPSASVASGGPRAVSCTSAAAPRPCVGTP